MKQILLITDGCSNLGVDPVVAAAQARAEGIVVNVIGVVDEGELGRRGEQEVAQIAEAGGGMHRIVTTKELGHTVQMMTRQTVAMTIQQVVNKELKSITGGGQIDDLPIEQRSKVVRVMDELNETSDLRVVLLIDTSASMKPKLSAVEEAIRDLMLSFEAREGQSELAVLHFPGKGALSATAEVLLDWTSHLAQIRNLFYKLNMKGATPTGPAIMKSIEYYGNEGVLSEDIG